MKEFRPIDYQPPLPIRRLLLQEKPGNDALQFDVLFIGAGPAGLAGAIELARLSKGELQIAVLEKAAELGNHSLSGAIVHPGPFLHLFPDTPFQEFPFQGRVEKEKVYFLSPNGKVRVPTPPTLRNRDYSIGSICEIVRWLGEKASELGVNVLPGFPADSLLMSGAQVLGARTSPAGLRKNAPPSSSYLPPTDLAAKVTVLSEGVRGSLTQAFFQSQKIASRAPQIFALGVKELWQVPRPPRETLHTLGWPLPQDAFGGSFIYPMGDSHIAFGLVVGLDYKQADLDVHELLQRFKTHPILSETLRGGELVEWGAKAIPEGGFYSLPERLAGDGVLVVGDAAGFVNVASLKGIHYAMHSGILAAHAIFKALRANDLSGHALSAYDQYLRKSFIWDDLYRSRNLRSAFKSGLFAGGVKAGLITLTSGAFPVGQRQHRSDAEEPRFIEASRNSQAPSTLSKVDAVYRSGNATRDDIPDHLIAREHLPPEVIDFYVRMCPAGVFEREGDRLVIRGPNCIDCKTTDILGPRWTPREGGSGPKYRKM